MSSFSPWTAAIFILAISSAGFPWQPFTVMTRSRRLIPMPRCDKFQSLMRPGLTILTKRLVPFGACSTCSPSGA
eukprot:Skav211811  [mRNA]  locus=scaffold305:501312:502792:+ [translate_table: standard]